MHALSIIRDFLGTYCNEMHSKRQSALAKAVEASIVGGLGVVKMAKVLSSQASLRHRIKCCDRLLSNPALAKDALSIYRALAHRIIGERRTVGVIVDWSPLRDDGSAQLIRAAVIVKGRAITIYEEVYRIRVLGAMRPHRKFMKNLRQVLPIGCQPVIITDSGFRGTWFKLLDKLGYDWLGRIRNCDLVRPENHGADWAGCKTLYLKARGQVRDLGRYEYAKSNPVMCRMVLSKRPRRGRTKKTKMGKKARSRASQKNAACNREPWLLAASKKLDGLSAETLVQLYAGRMQIEQTFRDLKCPQWGMGLRTSQTRTKNLTRLSNLVLIATLAAYALWLIGLAAKGANVVLEYGSRQKAATTSSILTLARYLIDPHHWHCKKRPQLSRSQLKEALVVLRSMVFTYEK